MSFKVTIDTSEFDKQIKELKIIPKQVKNAAKKTVTGETTRAYTSVMRSNGAYETSYRDTTRIPLTETSTKVESGISNSSGAFKYFEYGTGTGQSKGALNGEWYLPVDRADLSKYYPKSKSGKYYVVKPQKAQRRFRKAQDLVESNIRKTFQENLEKEIK